MNVLKRKRRLALAVVAVTWIGLVNASVARAALVYTYTTGAANFDVPLGQSLQIPLFLQEDVTGEPSLLAAESLYSGGLTATRAASVGGPIDITNITGNTGTSLAAGGFAGGNAITSYNSSTASLEVNVGISNFGAEAINVSNGVNRVRLGTLTIQATAVAGMSTFALGPLAGGGVTLTNLGTFLDANSTTPLFAAATGVPFTVTSVVPEPGSFVLGLVALVGLTRRRNLSV